MREILFRGKNFVTGEWVEGFYYKAKYYRTDKELTDYITVAYPDEMYRGSDNTIVVPETVGQFTGLFDKNGKKIFEGDIVDIQYPDTFVCNTVISYIGASFYGADSNDSWELDNYFSLEVIGNIHDNPELIEGEK